MVKYALFQMLQIACIPYILGWIITIWASSVWLVYLSRLIVGASHALLTTSVYAVEITSKDMRARMSFFEGKISLLLFTKFIIFIISKINPP